MKMRVQTALRKAAGRTIVVGESHTNHESRAVTLDLIRQAHEAGYRTLGVEVSRESRYHQGRFATWGLEAELEYLRGLGDGELTEYDEFTYLTPRRDGFKPRMNRHWQEQLALQLGWMILPLDPFHWNASKPGVDLQAHSREPAMVEAIRAGRQMIAIFGWAHLGGICRELGNEVFSVTSHPVVPKDHSDGELWRARDEFAARLPQLIR